MVYFVLNSDITISFNKQMCAYLNELLCDLFRFNKNKIMLNEIATLVLITTAIHETIWECHGYCSMLLLALFCNLYTVNGYCKK